MCHPRIEATLLLIMFLFKNIRKETTSVSQVKFCKKVKLTPLGNEVLENEACIFGGHTEDTFLRE